MRDGQGDFNLSQPHSLTLKIQTRLWTSIMGVQRELLEVGVLVGGSVKVGDPEYSLVDIGIGAMY